MTSYDGQAITYDQIGNPLTYRDGMNFTWAGRQMATATVNGKSISYTYNSDGIRTSKTVDGITTDYLVDGSTIVAQNTVYDTLWFMYDSDGTRVGFTYHDDAYYYLKNAQGDVTGIVDSNLNVVVEYSYDAWGKLIETTGSEANFIGKLNPFLYRGYYYDAETGLYNLGGRYYDPVTGRFLNADEQINSGSILSENLYAYCYNNPTNMADYDGKEAITLTALGIYFLVTAVITLSTVAIVSTPEFQRSWNQMSTTVAGKISAGLGSLGGMMIGTINWASSKAKSIAKSIGDSFARKSTIPSYRTPREIHHIVAKKAPNAGVARTVLNNVGIGYNSSYNLVSIKTGLHRRLHTNEYYGWANSIVISAYNSASMNKTKQWSNVLGALNTLRGYLLAMDAVSPF
ncbi:RHS repeat-associated core domain-containing protein [Faecalispora jeddahensis]|uniref:RHS repeat-associated core domain-containing protein n=2 Tax=Faecalispora jeddahensis TaxID=1414721 RepID=UPI0027B95689|nr:RHS repeat-associated core domain-containing protein [Faecalispora jeddahensis]